MEDEKYAADRRPYRPEQAYAVLGEGTTIKEAAGICERSHGAISSAQTRECAGIPSQAQRKAARNALSKVVFPVEEEALLRWAKECSLLLSLKAFYKNWVVGGKASGAEHDLYFDERYGKWYKKNNLSYHSSYLDYFNRLALHNMLFPEAPLELLGFVYDEDSLWRKLQPAVSQRHVIMEGGIVSDEEMCDYMTTIGYHRIPGTDHDYYSPETGVRVEDLHDENVLRSGGELFVIDPVIYLDSGTWRIE